MTDELKDLWPSAVAAEYINERIGHAWKDPVGNLGLAVYHGNISPVDIPGTEDMKRVPFRLFSKEECDRFITEYTKKGKREKDLGEVEDLLGQKPDTVLAEMAGVSVRTISRRRELKGIPTYRKHAQAEAA